MSISFIQHAIRWYRVRSFGLTPFLLFCFAPSLLLFQFCSRANDIKGSKGDDICKVSGIPLNLRTEFIIQLLQDLWSKENLMNPTILELVDSLGFLQRSHEIPIEFCRTIIQVNKRHIFHVIKTFCTKSRFIHVSKTKRFSNNCFLQKYSISCHINYVIILLHYVSYSSFRFLSMINLNQFHFQMRQNIIGMNRCITQHTVFQRYT